MAKFDWKFINLKLDKSDKNNVHAFAEEFDNDPTEVIDDITELGYKVSISYVDDRNSYVVSVSGSERTAMNNKMTITTWSNNLQECVFMAGYKILKLAKDKSWSELDVEQSDWG